MKCFPILRTGFLLCLLALIPAIAAGQDSDEESKAAAGVRDHQIELDDLDLMLLPLTKEELEKEAGEWMGLLQAKVRELSDKQMKSRKAEGDEQTRLLDEVAALQNERIALVDRVNAVLDDLEEKGGDVEDHRKYITAVSGITVEVTDVSATYTTIMNWLSSEEGGIRWGLNILKFLVTLFVFWILGNIVARITDKAVRTLKKTSELLRDFFVNSVRRITFFIGIVIALSMLEVNIGPFLAAIGVIGFVIGFALQDTLSNFASGIMLLVYRPYDIGDVVNAAGVLGQVSAMSLVSTTIKTFDNQNMVVPNSSIWGNIITNITANKTRRVDLTFGIGYEDDIDKAHGILEDIVAKHPLVLKDPEPVIRLHELADSSVNFIVRPWVNGADYWAVYWDITKSVKERFDAEGVSIPFPQRDVHVHQMATTGEA